MKRSTFLKTILAAPVIQIADPKTINDLDLETSTKLVERLKSLPDDDGQWIGYNLTFNKWEFPIDFYDLIPSWWHKPLNEKPYDMRRRSTIIHPVMQVVEDKYGRKELLRCHNVNRMSKMTDQEFEYWFALSNDKQTEYHERKRFMDGICWWKDEVFEKIKSLNLASDPIT